MTASHNRPQDVGGTRCVPNWKKAEIKGKIIINAFEGKRPLWRARRRWKNMTRLKHWGMKRWPG